LWSVAIAKSSLGDDGEKVLTAKVTEVGLDESLASNAVTFTLDTVKPSATSLAATADQVATTDSAVATLIAGTVPFPGFTNIVAIDAVPGTWTISCQGDSTATVVNLMITTPVGVSSTYLYTGGVFPYITGFNTSLDPSFISGDAWTVAVTAATDVIVSRAKILFSEAVTNATATTLANYVFTDTTTAVVSAVTDPAAASYTSLYAYFNTFTAPTLTLNDTLTCTVDDMVDLAGNAQTTASYLTCTVGAASETSLAP